MDERMQFQSPEEEIRYLESKILEKKKEMSEAESRSVVKETLKEHIEGMGIPIVPTLRQNPIPLRPPKKLDKNVARLVQVAFQEGILVALERVRKTHNPHLIDAFHDALTDRFMHDLRERGLLSFP